ncbi:MAG: response regulator [Acidimicrobiales bacterium]|nr:response regulator [Acidimicrobiales bacterium]
MADERMEQAETTSAGSVLVIDDDETFRRSLVRMAQAAGYRCEAAEGAVEARGKLEESAGDIDVVLCDIQMPGESGLDLLPALVADHPGLAIVMMTGLTDPETAARAVEIGADGYLVKPFDRTELLVAVATAVKRRSLDRTRAVLAEGHERAVLRVRDLSATLGDFEARGAPVSEVDGGSDVSELIDRLSRAVSLRHEETAKHLERMSRFAAILGSAVGFSDYSIDELRVAAALHDVGKIGVPDSVLLKPGRLDPSEYAVIQKHASYGYRLLAGSQSRVIAEAANVALCHHEWWDGSGYPLGIQGEEISEGARIVAVTDVFDALTSDRVYRPRHTFDEAQAMMTELRGRQFEPRLLDAFFAARPQLEAIAAEYPDHAPEDERVRLMVVDDHEIFLDSLVRRLALEEDLRVVGVARSVEEARRGIATYEPDVVLMDFELPDGDGAEATEHVKRYAPAVKVVMLTGRTDQAAMVRALAAGCSGFVTKTEGADHLIGAIRHAHHDEAVPSPADLAPLLAELSGTQRGLGATLSLREIEVLELVAAGLPNKAIGERLYLSVHTVRNHVQRILEKLHVHSKLEAVSVAVREGIIVMPRM